MEKKVIMLMILGVGVVMGLQSENAITCQEALTDLRPCMPFLTAAAGADKPGIPCCLSVRTVFLAANTPQIRRDLCGCFKTAAAQLRVKPERAKQIPTLCNIPLSIPIDPNVDCSKVNN